MPHYQTSRQAKNDLRQIGIYTERVWGKAQRRKYLSSFDAKFSLLADNPLMTNERREFTPPVRIHHHGSHLIVYIVRDMGVLIVRVLHQNADIDTHLL